MKGKEKCKNLLRITWLTLNIYLKIYSIFDSDCQWCWLENARLYYAVSINQHRSLASERVEQGTISTSSVSRITAFAHEQEITEIRHSLQVKRFLRVQLLTCCVLDKSHRFSTPETIATFIKKSIAPYS